MTTADMGALALRAIMAAGQSAGFWTAEPKKLDDATTAHVRSSTGGLFRIAVSNGTATARVAWLRDRMTGIEASPDDGHAASAKVDRGPAVVAKALSSRCINHPEGVGEAVRLQATLDARIADRKRLEDAIRSLAPLGYTVTSNDARRESLPAEADGLLWAGKFDCATLYAPGKPGIRLSSSGTFMFLNHQTFPVDALGAILKLKRGE